MNISDPTTHSAPLYCQYQRSGNATKISELQRRYDPFVVFFAEVGRFRSQPRHTG